MHWNKKLYFYKFNFQTATVCSFLIQILRYYIHLQTSIQTAHTKNFTVNPICSYYSITLNLMPHAVLGPFSAKFSDQMSLLIAYTIVQYIGPYSVADPGFPWGGVPTPQGGRQHTILPNFPKNCMKLKEFGPPGGHTSLLRSATGYWNRSIDIVSFVILMNRRLIPIKISHWVCLIVE